MKPITDNEVERVKKGVLHGDYPEWARVRDVYCVLDEGKTGLHVRAEVVGFYKVQFQFAVTKSLVSDGFLFVDFAVNHMQTEIQMVLEKHKRYHDAPLGELPEKWEKPSVWRRLREWVSSDR